MTHDDDGLSDTGIEHHGYFHGVASVRLTSVNFGSERARRGVGMSALTLGPSSPNFWPGGGSERVVRLSS